MANEELNPPEASYLITFRDSDGSRLPLLRAVVAWLTELPHLEVIVVEQDRAPVIGEGIKAHNLQIVSVFNDGAFNKSWGLNVAARHARHDLLVIGDADMVMPAAALNRALAVCAGHFDAVNPYRDLVDLTPSETEAYLQGELELQRIHREHSRRPQGEHICFCGGICVFRRDVYFALGGMDERFRDWGGEDDAMSINLTRYTDKLAVQDSTVAYHLWHPRHKQRYQHAAYRHNLAYVGQWMSYREAQLEDRRNKQRESMGQPHPPSPN